MAESGDRRDFLKKAAIGSIALASVPTLGATLSLPATADEDEGDADRVRWDIISLDRNVPAGFFARINPGGESFAEATRHDGTFLRIRFTGSGTFVAPSGRGFSRRAKGGGTWQTFGPGPKGTAGPAIANGTYEVRRLVTWEFLNMQALAPPAPQFIDAIGNENERANGTAVLLIRYSDGGSGILGILCHGPGAGTSAIHEGVIATKRFETYVDSEGPTATFSDKNRTIFHVRHIDDDD